jgi:RNA-binding protein YhbY
MKSLNDKIIGRIRARGRGHVYVAKDFLDLGSRPAVDQALWRLARDGVVRRIGRGLYDYPRRNASLDIVLSPDMDRVAQAVARRRGSNLQRSGATAANALGLSTQVPGKNVYLTDAATGQFTVGKQKFTMKRVTPKGVRTRDKVVNPVLQALYFIGKDGITDDVVRRLRATLSAKDKKKLLRQSRYTVDWVSDAVQRVVREDKVEVGNG